LYSTLSITAPARVDETFDIGSDTRTTLDNSYKLPFRFTGKIDKLTYKLDPEQMTNDEQNAFGTQWKERETKHSNRGRWRPPVLCGATGNAPPA
jgi:hypothetical protein